MRKHRVSGIARLTRVLSQTLAYIGGPVRKFYLQSVWLPGPFDNPVGEGITIESSPFAKALVLFILSCPPQTPVHMADAE